jgi:hypothetical protein
MRIFDDVLLFSIKSKMLKITRIAYRDNSFEFYRFTAMLNLDQRFSTDGSRPGNGSWQISNGSWANVFFYLE